MWTDEQRKVHKPRVGRYPKWCDRRGVG